MGELDPRIEGQLDEIGRTLAEQDAREPEIRNIVVMYLRDPHTEDPLPLWVELLALQCDGSLRSEDIDSIFRDHGSDA